MTLATESTFKKTIVIIEDDDINRELLKQILFKDYNVLEASNGKEGLDLLKRISYKTSLILLDIQMPIMDGYEFLKVSQNIEEIKSIPIIVTTSERGDEEKCLNIGASDFVSKPYMPNIILKRIQALIRLSEASVIVNETKYDKLTRIFSRTYFDVASNTIFNQNDGDNTFILLCIEDFQYYNATYGEKDGDALLTYVASILSSLDGKEYIGSRYGSERFAIYVQADKNETLKLINNIKEMFYKNVPIKHVELKFAYYLNPTKAVSVIKIMEYLSNAIETIYHDYLNDITEYNDDMLFKKNRERFVRENMVSSLENEEYQVYFQPKHDVNTDKLIGCEALVRWVHPKAGIIPPGDFIPLFEEIGFISDLDKYIIEKTCCHLNDLIKMGIKPVPVSINISRRDLAVVESTKVIDSILEKYDLPKNLIHFEITESDTAQDHKIITKAKMLQDAGYEIEIDDFGSGYSSLGILTDIPMNYLKLDIAFAKNINKQKQIIKTIISLAHALNVKTIAEGVETKEQKDIYKDLGIDYIQGYFYSKPLNYNEFINYIKKYN